jgi:hypothetical protein
LVFQSAFIIVDITGCKTASSRNEFQVALNANYKSALKPEVMKRFPSKLLQKAPSVNATQNATAHPDQLTMIPDNAMVVFQRVGSNTTSNIPELPAVGQIGIEIVEIIKVRPNEDYHQTSPLSTSSLGVPHILICVYAQARRTIHPHRPHYSSRPLPAIF